MQRFRTRVLAECSGLSPARALVALPAASQAVLLDSSGSRGWSILAWKPDLVVEGRMHPQATPAAAHRADEAELSPASRWPLAASDPAKILEDAGALECWPQPPAPLPAAAWVGGWIGWFSFECGHAWEPFPWVEGASALPDYHFARYRRALAFGPDGRAWLCLTTSPELELEDEQAEVLAEFSRLQGACGEQVESVDVPLGIPEPQIAKADFMAKVQQLRQWIGAGELFQANLSHSMRAPAPFDPRSFYCQVRRAQATEMSAYWQDGSGRALLSWSPERFLKIDGELLQTRPIKGTIARGGNSEQDQAAKLELDGDSKERAELTMIVDMARNDLGRVAESGAVTVHSAGTVETWPTLHHRTATIEARWNPQLGLAALLAATFPPASVTGAPKVRALQAISELEQEPRGPYCGCLGIWQPGRNRGDFSVLIRTAVVAGGDLSLRVGAGIVWDSDAELEWEETLLKANYLQQTAAGGEIPA